MPIEGLAQICTPQWPHDLKPCKNKLGGIVDCETFAGGLPLEVPFVCGSPPRKTAVAAAFIPRKIFVDVAQRLDLDLQNVNDAMRLVLAVNHHTKVSRLEQRFTTLDCIAEQSRCRTFLSQDDLCGKFIGEFYPITELQDDVLCMTDVRRSLEGMPEFSDALVFISVVSHGPPSFSGSSATPML
jgi:hypothetical protein